MTWRHFTREEFACRHCGLNLIARDFVSRLDELRERFGRPLIVTSGYRCREHNAAVSTTGLNGPHTSGRAADLAVTRGEAYELMRLAFEMGFTGIGVQQKGQGRFIHLDDLLIDERPMVWSY